MARPVWSGSISFGLVNVPVRAFTAVRDHDVHFHQIDKESGARVRNRKVSEKTGDEVEPEDIEMGFEVRKGRYVTFDKSELDELKPESTKAVEVTDFVELAAIDPVYYERTYWLAPGNGGEKAYQLLLAAMEDRARAAIGTVVMRNKQYLSAIRPLDGVLAMSTMRFADEVVPRKDVEDLPARRAKPEAQALRMATQLVDSLAGEWDPRQYHDTYTEELRQRIADKEAGKELTVAPEKEPTAKVVDLMEALAASVENAKNRRGPARRGGSSSSARSGGSKKRSTKATKSANATNATKATKASKARKSA